MEDTSYNFSTIARRLESDAAYWNQVGTNISPDRPIEVDDKGNLIQTRFWWQKEARSPAEAIKLFSQKFSDSTNQTLDDLTQIRDLMNRVSIADDQESYQVALRALIQLETGIKASFNSIEKLQKNSDFNQTDEIKAIKLQIELLENLQPNIRGLKSVILDRVRAFESDEFELLPEKEELDLIHPHLTWESDLIASPDTFLTLTMDDESQKNEVRKIILHAGEPVPIINGSDIMVSDVFQRDVSRNGRLTVNGIGYTMRPATERVFERQGIFEDIYREMARSMGEKQAQRIAPLLQQEIGASLNLEMFNNIFKDRFPNTIGTVYIDVKADEYNVNITAQVLFQPQFTKDGKHDPDLQEFVIGKKTITFPRSDLDAEDFETNPLPNVHVMEQFSPIVHDRNRAIEMLLHPEKSEEGVYSEKIDEEAKMAAAVERIKHYRDEGQLASISERSELRASSVFVNDLERFGGFKINGKSFLPDKDPFDRYDSKFKEEEIGLYKDQVFQQMILLLGEEGAMRAASLINLEFLGVSHEDIHLRTADIISENPEITFVNPHGMGALYVELEADGQSLKIKTKSVFVFDVPNEMDEFEWHDSVVGKQEIVIPLNELQASDFNEKENPIPGLHIAEKISVRIRDNAKKTVDLLRQF